jgi:uncharacterized iron-regulated protein
MSLPRGQPPDLSAPAEPPARSVDPGRRRLWTALLGAIALPVSAGCAWLTPRGALPHPWERRLQGNAVVLLGEVHDNAEHHRRRSAILRRALEAGWRPALVMEQFDIDRQADIERSRRERPHDARHVIASAGAARGWDWDFYAPAIALALQFDLPLLAGNLPRAMASRLSRESPEQVFGEMRARALGLVETPDAAWQAAMEREIDLGHCGALPRSAVAGIARAQFARDAVMASVMLEHAARGAVLLAGTGHVRRDIGVPRWLGNVAAVQAPSAAAPAPTLTAPRVLAVGFIELGGEPPAPGRFDATVAAPPAQREDPCKAFKARPAPSGG